MGREERKEGRETKEGGGGRRKEREEKGEGEGKV